MSDVEITSPMPAAVFEILVSAGDAVEAGQEIVILESMKMEVPVATPSAGVVEDLRVAVGDTLEPDQVIAVIRVE
jgi:biotin carboxyl carrier protein